LPAASPTVTLQERVASPLMWTVQAPHCAMPQPYLVPVSPTFSLIAQSSGVSGSTSTLTDFPLIVRFAIAIPVDEPDPPKGLHPKVEREAGAIQFKKIRFCAGKICDCAGLADFGASQQSD
jgi:hypothetical protein